MIDLHTHILPGLDDGAATMAEAVEIARGAWESGVRELVATPHVRDDYPTTPEQIETGLEDLRAALAAAGVPIRLHGGAELDVHRAGTLAGAELERFTLGEHGRYILLEVPYAGAPRPLEALADRLLADGFLPVLAHPERAEAFLDDPARVLPLVAAGCLVQVTVGSLLGDGGRRVRAAARQLLDLGVVHVLASDGHGAAFPRSGLADAAAVLEPALVARLTHTVPAAILAGEPVERPLPPAPGRRWWRQAISGR